MVNNRHNYVNLYPSIDAIEEFKVQTGNYSAEYGGNAGTNVNIQIKSGDQTVPRRCFSTSFETKRWMRAIFLRRAASQE